MTWAGVAPDAAVVYRESVRDGGAMDRRSFLRSGAAAIAATALGAPLRSAERPPNFVLVFCDDLGYGDIGAFGAKRVRTPNIDRLAREGTVLTDYYAAANLCTPSRAGLLTGRYPIRTGLAYEVIMQNDTRGLKPEEVTIAEALKPDYASAMIGKWHLGHIAPYWPPCANWPKAIRRLKDRAEKPSTYFQAWCLRRIYGI